MTLARTPPPGAIKKTASGRTSKTPLKKLYEVYDDVKITLEKTLSHRLSSDVSSNINLPELKKLARSGWHNYNDIYQQLDSQLENAGTAEELHAVRKEYLDLKIHTKSFISTLKWLYQKNEDKFSNIDSISNITSISKMSAGRRKNIEDKLNIVFSSKEDSQALELKMQRKLSEIETKKKALEAEESAVIQICNQEKQKIVEQDLVIQKLMLETELPKPGDSVLNVTVSSQNDEIRRLFKDDLTDRHVDTDMNDRCIPNVKFPGSQNKNIFSTIPTVGRNSSRFGNPWSLNPDAEQFNPRSLPQLSRTKIDPASRFLMISELKKSPSSPYKGDSYLFHGWYKSLENRMFELQLSPMDQIDVLEAHTIGPPQELVKLFKTVYGHDPEIALSYIILKLKKRFGDPSEIATALLNKLHSFPNITNRENLPNIASKLRELSDLCLLIEAHQSDVSELNTLNYASGLEPIRQKVPNFINNKWRVVKKGHMDFFGNHPNFRKFCEFLESEADILTSDIPAKPRTIDEATYSTMHHKNSVSSFRNYRIKQGEEIDESTKQFKCSVHESQTHKLKDCKEFKKLNARGKKSVLIKYNLCFKCYEHHHAKDCDIEVCCSICKSTYHVTDLHIDYNPQKFRNLSDNKFQHKNYERTPAEQKRSEPRVLQTSATFNRSCSKTILVDVTAPNISNQIIRVYCILDEQSNQSFISPRLLDAFGIKGPIHNYTLSTLSKNKDKVIGRIANNISVKGVSEKRTYHLPSLFENEFIPNTIDEVATPREVYKIPHLRHLHHKFNNLDTKAEVGLLLGRDSGDVLATKMINTNAPFAHHTALGWAVVGSVCSRNRIVSENCAAYKVKSEHDHFRASIDFPTRENKFDVFTKFRDDEEIDSSIEDKKFINLISNNTELAENGKLQLPLPLKNDQLILPDNSSLVLRRQTGTLNRLKKDTDKLKDCLKFMANWISNGDVERIPEGELNNNIGRRWYLPIFPVIHPKKMKVRLVYDSAAVYYGTSLNNNLMQGPDQNNLLYGVLLRFRQEKIAFVSDIESMYHCFMVNPEHRDYLRFYWFDTNNPNKEIVAYRAKVHVFGNKSSPSVAIMGLRKAAESLIKSQDKISQNTYKYISEGFYVDDGLGCSDSTDEAVEILKTAQSTLSKYKIKLHKILSNEPRVMENFNESGEFQKTEFKFQSPDLQRTLGVAWNVNMDSFTMTVQIPERTFTKRGILSIINSIYDPMGMASPVTLNGKLFQRKVLLSKEQELMKYDWDDVLPDEYRGEWEKWISSLNDLKLLVLPRCYKNENTNAILSLNLHVFADASKDAVGHVMYFHIIDDSHRVHVSFVTGASKVAPRNATSIPRLELCAAVAAVFAAMKVKAQVTYTIHNTYYYTDSSVVLAYIKNEEKRFTKYITRRTELIRNNSEPESWFYVRSKNNPADITTRPVTPKELINTSWLSGPKLLWNLSESKPSEDRPDSTSEENIPEIITLCAKTFSTYISFLSSIFVRISSWQKMIRITKFISNGSMVAVNNYNRMKGKPVQPRKTCCHRDAVILLIREAQRESYQELMDLLKKGKEVPNMHPLSKFCPFIDKECNLIRVAGRLQDSNLSYDQKHPIILPRKHPITKVIFNHYHSSVNHQGRHISYGALRTAGFFIEKGSSLIKNLIKNCITCRRLRSSSMQQQMSNLPPERVNPAPPFQHTGLDVMGPWSISDGPSTRKNNRQRKFWCVLFTCLSSRAVHIEPIPSLDVTAMKNALSRFTSIRGHCEIYRSDRGTNFIAANNETTLDSIFAGAVDTQSRWIFNPPHASHFGGAWERKIGQIKRSIDYAILQLGKRMPDYDEFNTFMQEACAIVNSTPLWEVSNDPLDPIPLSPSMLLTQREDSTPNRDFGHKDALAYGKRRWRRVQYIADQFWRKWEVFYLQQLQSRQKWLNKKPSLKEGDLVLIIEKNMPRKCWQTGVVIDVTKSSDNLVRSVKIKTCRSKAKKIFSSIIERPISSVVLLIEKKD